MFEIEGVRDRDRKISYSLHKETETLVHREKFEIEDVRDRKGRLYCKIFLAEILASNFNRFLLMI